MAKNLKSEILVVFLFVISRLPSLGNDFFNTDVWKWKQRIYDFGSGVFYLDFAKTIQKYHPGVVLMWIGTVGVKVYNFYYEVFLGRAPEDNAISTVFELHFVQKFFVALIIGVTLALIFHGLKELFGSRYAGVAVVFLSLEPFYVALTRVVHLEGLMSTFMIASFVWFFLFLQEKKGFLVSAFFAGLSFLTKSSSIFLYPFIGMILAVSIYLKKPSRKAGVFTFLKIYLKWVFATIVVYVALWPAMWVVPGEALGTVYRGIFTIGVERGHEQLYFGKMVMDPGIGFYPLVLFYKMSPYLLIGLVGSIFLRKSLPEEKRQFFWFCLLFALFYTLEITLPSKKLDRYILPTILSLVFIAAYFFENLTEWLAQKYFKSFLRAFLVLLLPFVFILLQVHPDYFSYYNPLGGGLRVAINIFEPKWIIGYHQVVDFFDKIMEEEGLHPFGEGESFANSENLENKLTVAFPEKYYTQIWPFIRKQGGWAVIEWLTPEAEKTKYFVYPVWDDFAYNEQRFNLEFKDKIYLRGTHVYNVYERLD